ncbi:MAG TPA: M56 family metallopeptidase [Vicinamibacterales bacterium]|jgi:TonB family protein|nr:M56 family metallopeptidase [Vicinamibacterales bacterium]
MITLVTLVNALSWLAQTTLVIAAGLFGVWAVKIDAPAMRYGALRAVLAFCLLLPAMQPRLPALTTSMEAQEASLLVLAAGALGDRAEGSASPRTPLSAPLTAVLTNAILLLIACGALGRVAWIAAGVVRLRALKRSGEIASSAEYDELQAVIGVRAMVRYVPGLGQPVTFGFRGPVVLLPERTRDLPEALRRAVAAHELWHVRRRDWLWTVTEETIRAALWFHPAIWLLLSRIQAAREEVVDELSVLTTGSRKSYIAALLTFADERPLFAATAFARRRHLVRRLLLISKESAMSSMRIVASSLALAAAVLATSWYTVRAFPLAQAQPPRDPVRTPSEIRSAAETAEKEAALEDRIASQPTKENYLILAQYAWERAFRDSSLGESQKAHYVQQGLDAATRALALDSDYLEALIYKNLLLRSKAQMTPDLIENRRLVVEADALRARAMELRKTQGPARTRAVETQVFAGAAAQAPPPPPPPPPPPLAAVDGVMPLRVGGNIAPPVKIHDVSAEYPPIARAAEVQGVVVLEVVIDAAGAVRDGRVLRSIPLLDKAALDAVRQWRFEPTLLNGQAVPVSMTITINFALP